MNCLKPFVSNGLFFSLRITHLELDYQIPKLPLKFNLLGSTYKGYLK